MWDISPVNGLPRLLHMPPTMSMGQVSWIYKYPPLRVLTFQIINNSTPSNSGPFSANSQRNIYFTSNIQVRPAFPDSFSPHAWPAHRPPTSRLITMVSLRYVVCALAAVSGVQAQCKRTCRATSDAKGLCTYNCTAMCSSLPATEARDNYLSALHSAGHSCKAKGTRGVECKKTSAFGSCYDHYWSCGSGC